jgi:hypothetical protein
VPQGSVDAPLRCCRAHHCTVAQFAWHSPCARCYADDVLADWSLVELAALRKPVNANLVLTLTSALASGRDTRSAVSSREMPA